MHLLQRIIRKTSINHPFLTLMVFFILSGFFFFHLPDTTLETDILMLAAGAEDEVRQLEAIGREFQIGDPLQVLLLGDTTEWTFLQQAQATIEAISQVPNVTRVINPFDALYIDILTLLPRIEPLTQSPIDGEVDAENFLRRLKKSPDGQQLISDDQQALLLDVYIRGGVGERGKAAIAAIDNLLRTQWGHQYALTGNLFIAYSADQSVLRDVLLLFPVAAIIVMLFMYVVFRSVWGILVPGLTVIVSIGCTLGIMAWLDYPLTLVSAILPVVLVVMGTADGIHILHKYREVYGGDKKEGIAATMAAMAPPVIMTSVTTAVGLAALRVSSVIPVQEFGTFSAVGVLIAMVFSLGAIPAILVLIPPLPRHKGEGLLGNGVLLGKLAGWSVRYGRLLAFIGLIIFFVGIFGASQLQVESNIARYFRSGSRVAAGISLYEEKFGGSTNVIAVIDTGQYQGAVSDEFFPILLELEDYIASLPLVTHTVSAASLAASVLPDALHHVNLLALAQQFLPREGLRQYMGVNSMQKTAIHTYISSSQTNQLSATLGEIEQGLIERLPPDYQVTIAGLPRIIQFYMERFSESQIRSLFWSVLFVFVIVAGFFRSLGLGFVAMLPLLFSISINFGIMGYLGIPLDAATILIASVSIGVGIDYSIHFLSRIFREKNALSKKDACRYAAASVGHAIFINALSLIVGFGILFFSVFSMIATFGALMAMTMAISAIAALTLLPAILSLQAQKNDRRENV